MLLPPHLLGSWRVLFLFLVPSIQGVPGALALFQEGPTWHFRLALKIHLGHVREVRDLQPGAGRLLAKIAYPRSGNIFTFSWCLGSTSGAMQIPR